MNKKVGLVVSVLNNFDQAVDSIYSAKTKDNELKIYIQPQYRFQVPLAKSWNNGIYQAMNDGCDYIIIANDDVLYAPFTIDSAVELMESDQAIDLLGFMDATDTFSDPFEITFAEKNDKFKSSSLAPDPVYPKDLFSLVMIRNNFLSKFGTFDENFDPAWWEDTDMLYRLHLLGGKVFISRIPFIHLRHQTTKKLTIPINSLKSQQYYEKKWGSCRKDLHEAFTKPYNDNNLNPNEWRKL
jgi:GT2 family glycosyltransferase